MTSRAVLLDPAPRMSRFVALATLGALLVAISGCKGETVAPPVPHVTDAWIDTLPPVPTSYVDVPVRYDLAPALHWLESAIPLTIGDITQRHEIPGKKRTHYAFALTRKPFHVKVNGRDASLVAEFQYQARVWHKPAILPEISGSCGTQGEQPRARLVIATNVELTHRWTLQPHTIASIEPVTDSARDRCRVTLFHIDVTAKALGAAQEAVQAQLTHIDRRLATFKLHRDAEKAWDVLRSPLRLTDSLWLMIDPLAVRIGMLKLERDTLVTTVGLSAKPRIIGGSRPQALERALPAPQDSTTRPPVLHLLTEARLPYDVASLILTDKLKGTEIRVEKRRLVVKSIHLSGVGDGRVAVGLAVTGSAEGTLYAVGRPAFDTSSAELYMPDLVYDIGTEDVLVGALAWLKQADIEDFLRNKVRIKMAHVIEQGRALVERNLNRELVPGVRLRARVNAGHVFGVRAAPDALLARAVVSGRGELVLNLEPESSPARFRERLATHAP